MTRCNPKIQKRLDVSVTGPIEDGWADKFANDLRQIGHACGALDEIVLRIESAGGSTFAGLIMYDTLLRHPARVTCDVVRADSAASILAMACDHIRIHRTGSMLIHQPEWIGPEGETDEDRADIANTLQNHSTACLDAYSRRIPREVAERLMSEGRVIHAKEAKRLGLVDWIT